MEKVFKWKKIRRGQATQSVNPQPPANEAQTYTGVIDGLKASQGEENLYRAAYKTGLVSSHYFRMAIGAPRNKPGYKELDFLFETKTGDYVAIQIRDYDFVHKGLASAGKDAQDDSFVLVQLTSEGINVRGNRIYTISDDDLTTLEDAVIAIGEII
jgi:hypothetical protein